MAIILYTLKYPEKVKALAPISTVVSGQMLLDVWGKDEILNWRNSGWKIHASVARPGIVKTLKYGFAESIRKYDILSDARNIKVPVLLIVGEKDDTTLPAQQQMLYDNLKSDKELHIIEGAPHSFSEHKHLEIIKGILLKWIDKISR